MESFAVIFDMDGLMLDSERMARRAWTRALADLGYDLDGNEYLRLVGRTVQDAEHILTGLFGPALPFREVFVRRQAYYDQDIEQNGIPVKPGLLDLLAFLDNHHITRAVGSSTPCVFGRRKLAAAGLADRFSVVVCGDMVARGKPAPDLFLETARQIDYSPERCVVLEDSEAGILAAHEAGALPVMVPDLKQPAAEVEAIAYRVLPTLQAVIPLMEGFLKDGLPLRV